VKIPCLICTIALATVSSLRAQEDASSYIELSEVDEIALARSAAPATVSADATIWVIRDGKFQVAVHGTSGSHCFVQRSHPLSLEPICYDLEGSATIMRWEFEHFRARTGGASREGVEEALARAVGRGEVRIPARPAVSYMMSSEQQLYDPESGRSAGNWKPHLMIYMPYITPETVGLGANTPGLIVAEAGTPIAHLIIVVPEFTDPNQQSLP